MEVNCEGCAGCCMNWRPLLEEGSGSTAARDDEGETTDESERRHHQQRDPLAGEGTGTASREPLDDDTIFVSLTRDEVRRFLEEGMGDALTPRFWHARDEAEGVEIDGVSVAAIAGRPAFFVGLRKPPKPVAPFGREEPTWLPACVFLDPTTLQCRIHESELYPDECGAYPEYTLAFARETECERVESAFGGDRLLEDDHDGLDGLLLGSQAIGAKLFSHPRPADLEGIVDRAASGELTRRDRAETIAVAAASSPGTLAISDHHYDRAKARLLDGEDTGSEFEDNESWVGPAIRDWQQRCREAGEAVPPPSVADDIETARGAPETPGWDALE